MTGKLRHAYRYLNYRIKSKHRNGHGIHSPFVYEFVSKVLFDRKPCSEYDFIKTIREELKACDDMLSVGTMGAGSVHFSDETRRVKDLADKSSVQPKLGKLLFRIGRYYKPATIIELGTSIGLSTLYLAKGAPHSGIVTIEGNKELCEYARSLFKKYRISNIKAIHGYFDDYLPYFEENYPSPGLVFIDGNHTCEATLRYFNFFINQMKEGFLIFDDINWSPGMRKAWREIQHDSSVQVTIDLYFMGIIMKRKSITPGHFLIRF